MLYTLTAQASFSTTHQSSFPERCSRHLHGHTFLVKASATHEEVDDGIPRGTAMLQIAVQRIALEFDGRTMREMAVIEDPTHVNLAAYFFERLSADFRGLSRVEIYADDLFGIVEKQ